MVQCHCLSLTLMHGGLVCFTYEGICTSVRSPESGSVDIKLGQILSAGALHSFVMSRNNINPLMTTTLMHQ